MDTIEYDPDVQCRLECIRLASLAKPGQTGEEILEAAKKYYSWVKDGQPA